jgi:hypothetical protein
MNNSEFVSALRQAGLINGRTVVRKDEDGVVDTRYLGQWQVPDGEDDDGDYDWQVPTDATRAAIRRVCEQTGWRHDVGEKNWVTFTR